jgi:hypothetical protein
MAKDKCLSSRLTIHSNNNFIKEMKDSQSTNMHLVHQFENEIAFVVAIWTFSTGEIIVFFPASALSVPSHPFGPTGHEGCQNF